MTKYEKLSTVLGTVALIAAIASPFISYRWLQVSVQETKVKASGFKTGAIEIIEGLRVDISNEGPLPVGKVLVSFRQCCNQKWDDNVADILKVNPPVKIAMTVSDDTILVTLEDAMAPGQKSKITLFLPSDEKGNVNLPYVHVSSEATPPTPVVVQPPREIKTTI